MSHLARWMILVLVGVLAASNAGCGTTRMSDTSRTGTEQLLLSTAIDQAINNIDFKPLTGKKVYVDTSYLAGAVDEKYLTSTLRQHMMAHGCLLQEKRDDASYIVEARAGAIGTNRNEVVIGVPSINLPGVTALAGVPSAIPEIPFAKTTDQRGVAKIAVFAYNRETGTPIWQSGVFPVVSNAKDSWILGAGPFQRGSIYDGTRFAGNRLIFRSKKQRDVVKPRIPVTAEAVFEEPPVIAQEPKGDLSANEQPQPEVTQAQALQPAPQQDQAPAESPEKLPAGRILRLPPLEQAARPDLQATDELSAQEPVPEDSPPRRLEPTAAEGNAAEPAQQKQRGFSLLRPGTWFGGGASPSVQYP